MSTVFFAQSFLLVVAQWSWKPLVNRLDFWLRMFIRWLYSLRLYLLVLYCSEFVGTSILKKKSSIHLYAAKYTSLQPDNFRIHFLYSLCPKSQFCTKSRSLGRYTDKYNLQNVDNSFHRSFVKIKINKRIQPWPSCKKRGHLLFD